MPPLAYMALDEWKTQHAAGTAPADVVLVKYCVTAMKQIDEDRRRVRITMSTATVDRDNDTIAVEGWDLAAYQQNPVVLWAHQYASLPVARAVELHSDGQRLSAVDEFVSREVYPFADTVYQLLKAGYLNTSSVGFRGKRVVLNQERGGYDFVEQELLEHSIVPVPANPEALIEARSMLGPDVMQPLVAWCEEMLDTWQGDKGERQAVEQVHEAASSKTVYVDLGTLDKGTVPRDVSTETAPNDTEWSRPRLRDFTDESFDALSATQRRRIAGHYAWSEVNPPETFGQLSLPHHQPGDGAIVLRGVFAAMGALLGARGGVDIPEADRRPVYNHLARHYRAFDLSPPEFRFVEAQVCKHLPEAYQWEEATGTLAETKMLPGQPAPELSDDPGGGAEEQAALDGFLLAAYEEYIPSQLDALTGDDLKALMASSLSDAVAQMMRQQMARATGRVLDDE